MSKNYWLVKSDPESYGWSELEKDGRTDWTGVRNFQARNNLKAMKYGDEVFFYHSQIGKDIVGLAQVTKEFFTDPTADSEQWVAVELSPKEKFLRTITLEEIKKNSSLLNMMLVSHSRLSVMPVSKEEYKEILRLSKKKD